MLIAAGLGAFCAGTTQAQTPEYAPPVYAPSPASATTAPQLGGATVPPRPSIRQLFANTLAQLVNTTGTTLTLGLTQALNGSITNWLDRKLARASGVPVGSAGAPAIAPQVTYAPPQDPNAALGSNAVFVPPADPSAAPIYAPPVDQTVAAAPLVAAPVQYFDPSSGAITTPPPTPPADALFAGLAFEVHALDPSGATIPVDPASRTFRTGERFVVFYRPTLPGRMQVFNINPLGVQTQIDALDMAAGQLAKLGPYEFAATRGEDRLRLVLDPCTSPTLMVATRDIVKVSDAQALAVAPVSLGDCGAPATRSIRTRDIRKVAVEGATGFALDAVTPQELSSGRVDPREVTIVFRHE